MALGPRQRGSGAGTVGCVERQPPCPRATTTLAGFQAAEVGVFSVFRVRFLLRFGCR
jgi:hypothetical protein